MTTHLRALWALPVLFLVAVLAGCGRGGDSGGDSGGSTADASASTSDSGEARDSSALAGEPASGPSGPSGPSGGGNDSSAKQAAITPALGRSVISTGQVTLHSETLGRAGAEVMRLVTSWNGAVADEQTESDDKGRVVSSTMTLRVPTPRFSEAMEALAGVGEVDQQSRKSEDVTTKVIDNDARVRAAERSIRQIENLLTRATKLGDVIAIESDLARRQADLDSLKSQQAWLEDQTSLSTINVYLSRTGKPAPQEKETRGFLAGLDDGWTALKTATVAASTVLGAVLPWAVLLLVLGVPVWLVVRRRGAGRVSAGSAPGQSA